MNAAFSLRDKVALVTGGNRGIGFGMAAALAGAGADVAVVGRDETALVSAKEKLAAYGGRIWTFAYDLADTEGIDAFYRRVVAEAAPIDILVNNAGLTRRAPATDLSLADWELVHRVDLTAVFACSRAFARERIETGRPGKIINTASLASEVARPTIAAYTSAKGAVKQLTRALAVEWAPHHINVNAIGPGYILTDLTRPLSEDDTFNCWIRERTPMGRWGTPADLAGATVFLASSASDFVTGQILYVDGGILSSL